MSVKRRKNRGRKPRRMDLKLDELKDILDRAKAALSDDDHATLSAAVDTLAFLTQELEVKGVTIDRLRQLIFGASTEKTKAVLARVAPDAQTPGEAAATDSGDTAGAAAADEGAATEQGDAGSKPKRRGHGRKAAADYTGADKVEIPHPDLAHGDPCPECPKGKVYRLKQPAVLVRIRGVAPLKGTVYEMQRLRCNACGQVFTAPAPEGVGQQKYDETAAGLIALLKYGCGLPFNRIERLERELGIPLPAGTQWEVVERAADLMAPAHDELIRQAAQGEVLHNDDTPMKILELMRPSAEDQPKEPDDPLEGRKGIFTSGVVAATGGHRVALFFTGNQHAGENLADVLRKRAAGLAAPIQMCDALSRNTTGVFGTIVANCLAHSRRRYVDVAASFPDECRFVLEKLRDVYKNDELAREGGMSPQERLLFHQQESKPLMDELKKWMEQQFEQRLVEPNSGLGEAITYMTKHWTKLTRFLEEPGAPLDNNLCERTLKKAILHRKNSYFYKTENGARVGDRLMSLIHTAELAGVEAFGYLVALQRHHQDIVAHPADWMPWNYRQTMARLGAAPAAPA